MADIFDVVADTTRRDILAILLDRYASDDTFTRSGHARGGISVSEIVAFLGLSQPTVSKHLKVLREAGLVSVREMGQHRFYSLRHQPLEEIEDWLLPFTTVDDEVDSEALARSAVESLNAESRAIASRIGKAVAETTFQVGHVVDAVSPRHWRRGGDKP